MAVSSLLLSPPPLRSLAASLANTLLPPTMSVGVSLARVPSHELPPHPSFVSLFHVTRRTTSNIYSIYLLYVLRWSFRSYLRSTLSLPPRIPTSLAAFCPLLNSASFHPYLCSFQPSFTLHVGVPISIVLFATTVCLLSCACPSNIYIHAFIIQITHWYSWFFFF